MSRVQQPRPPARSAARNAPCAVHDAYASRSHAEASVVPFPPPSHAPSHAPSHSHPFPCPSPMPRQSTRKLLASSGVRLDRRRHVLTCSTQPFGCGQRAGLEGGPWHRARLLDARRHSSRAASFTAHAPRPDPTPEYNVCGALESRQAVLLRREKRRGRTTDGARACVDWCECKGTLEFLFLNMCQRKAFQHTQPL